MGQFVALTRPCLLLLNRRTMTGTAMEVFLTDSGLQKRENREANPKAFHSISEPSCCWQEEQTAAGTKELNSGTTLPFRACLANLFFCMWVFQKCLKHLKQLFYLSFTSAAGNHYAVCLLFVELALLEATPLARQWLTGDTAWRGTNWAKQEQPTTACWAVYSNGEGTCKALWSPYW